MATVGQLTKTIAGATGVPEPTVVLVVRSLREAGLVTTGARGKNAPRMTPLDAMRILIALLGSDRPVDAARVVKDFGQFLRFLEYRGIARRGSDDKISVRDDVRTTFENDGAAIIANIADEAEEYSSERTYFRVEFGEFICLIGTGIKTDEYRSKYFLVRPDADVAARYGRLRSSYQTLVVAREIKPSAISIIASALREA